MATGKHQHFVPQMMIREFAGDDGKLAELFKPKLTLGTKRRSPKGILFIDDFYKDRVSDLDESLFHKIEQRFAGYYPLLVEGNPRAIEGDGEAGAALADWICSMLCRGPFFEHSAEVMAASSAQEGKFAGLMAAMWKVDRELIRNYMRQVQFEQYQDWISRPNWRWKLIRSKSPSTFVLTDNPVCITRVDGSPGLIVLTPLSKHLVLVGGLSTAVGAVTDWTVGSINVFLSGWAGKSIFAADKEPLMHVAHCLRADTPWHRQARKPYLGVLDGMKTVQWPDDDELKTFHEDQLELYGPSRLKPRPTQADS